MENVSRETESAAQEREGMRAEAGGASGNNLDALLQGDASLQSQFDQKVSKALNTARSNWEKAQAEADDQRAAQRQNEQERELNAREQAILLRERKAEATADLGKRGLPVELAECLRYENDESLAQSLDAMEKAFSAEVQRAVQERLAGMPPKGGGQPAYSSQMRAALGLK